jgi:flavin reductase (DIM6/NTAB) family NADH-FMN oxidoreductase RutF
MAAQTLIEKIDIRPEWWDNIFAPSSCLVLITTISGAGRVNAAAFGTCTRVCHDPVHIAFTVGLNKDTANNVLETGEFVVNVVPFDQDLLDRTLTCGLPFKPGVNELEQAGLTALPARKIKPPRIAECRSHFECSIAWTKPWLHRLMVCGKVEAVSANSDCVDANGYIVWNRMMPAHYCGFRYGNRFVPAYDKPTEAFWRHEGSEDVFLEGEDWRSSFYWHLKKVAD